MREPPEGAGKPRLHSFARHAADACVRAGQGSRAGSGGAPVEDVILVPPEARQRSVAGSDHVGTGKCRAAVASAVSIGGGSARSGSTEPAPPSATGPPRDRQDHSPALPAPGTPLE